MGKLLKKWVLNIDDVISVSALSGIIIITIVSVFLRFVVNSPLAWAEEVTLGLFVWLIFVGVSSTMKRQGHIGIDYFVRRMPNSVRIVAEALRYFTIYFVCIVVFLIMGLQFAIQAKLKITPVLGISYTAIDIAVPLGGLLACVHLTIHLVNEAKALRNKEEN
ncbi:TRAP transporter small permease [Bacillus solitudinis]|uniref:TRAP transporter small permease n=1 Tax=Bacillus solitudinis TaxID=2014074 RepID=UPI000C24E56B|nr:TRAP transporter small permease [Bacillus solitudinis]